MAGALLAAGCTSFTGQTPHEDGRFTIGVNNHRLMYGYPVPYSTSHFVVAVDGQYASNTPAFPADAVKYIYNQVVTEGTEGSARKIITYDFSGVQITQRLIPVDGSFRDVAPGGWGQYYRIEYDIVNRSNAEHSVGLMLLIDTMIEGNDASQMDADGTRVAKETRFAGASVPGEILVYEEPGNTHALIGTVVTAKGKAVRPDEIYIGGWPAYHKTVWDATATGTSYFDSAILMKWNAKPLAPAQRRYLATHYGVRGSETSKIQALTEGPGFRRETSTVYFDFAKAELNEEGKRAIDGLLDGKTITGAFVEVYTDAVGNPEANLKLSKRRAESVQSYMTTRGISNAVIIPKAYGESFADQTADTTTGGKREDRKAIIVVYVKQ
jgi:outer membrane protein OmpA-like peptidoglycan-associated protein